MSTENPIKTKLPIQLTDITRNNVGQLKELNKAVLPVQYSQKHYDQTVQNWPRENPWCRLAYHNEYLVGAVNSRIELYNPENPIERASEYVVLGDKTREFVTSKQRKGKALTTKDGKPAAYRLAITTLCVLPAYQNNQIGALLLHEIINAADKLHQDIDQIYVQVHVDNQAAIDFYTRHGFQNIGRFADYYTTNSVSPPDAFFLSRPTRAPASDEPQTSQ